MFHGYGFKIFLRGSISSILLPHPSSYHHGYQLAHWWLPWPSRSRSTEGCVGSLWRSHNSSHWCSSSPTPEEDLTPSRTHVAGRASYEWMTMITTNAGANKRHWKICENVRISELQFKDKYTCTFTIFKRVYLCSYVNVDAVSQSH